MKKFLTIVFAVLFMGSVFSTPVIACEGSNCGNHYGWSKKHHNNNHNNNHNRNTNLNSNTNRNNNTNLQGQAQGQLQGQLQGQAQAILNSGNSSSTGGNATIENGAVSNDANNGNVNNQDVTVNVAGDQPDDKSVTVNNNAAEQKDVTTSNLNMTGNRDFANPGMVNYAQLPSFFGSAENNGNIRSVKTIIMYKNVFTRADVKGLLKGVNSDSDRTVPEIDDRKDTDTVTVVLVPVDKKLVERQCAVITSKSITDKVSSVNVLAGAIIEALDSGADLLVITGEGAGSDLQSFGWGIGLAYSHATIAVDERSSGIGSGGFGISGGRAGYGYYPWVQGIALKTK